MVIGVFGIRPITNRIASARIAPWLAAGVMQIQRAPLFGHRPSNTNKRAAPFLPPIRSRRHAVYPMFPALYDVRRSELWQPTQPQTGCLRLAMSELPRLHDLIRLAPQAGHDAHGILDAHSRHVCSGELQKELDGFCLLFGLVLEQTRTGHGKVCAWWVRDKQVPRLDVSSQHLEHVSLHVPPAVTFCWQQVATVGGMTERPKRSADDPRVFASNKHFHNSNPLKNCITNRRRRRTTAPQFRCSATRAAPRSSGIRGQCVFPH